MSQSKENNDGTFQFPATSEPTPLVPSVAASSPPDMFQNLKQSQADLDRLRAEKLIESLSDDATASTVVSFASTTPTSDEGKIELGTFAEKDPYVNEESIASPTNSARQTQPKSQPVTKSEMPTELPNQTSPAVAPPARTVEDILALIPGYSESAEEAAATAAIIDKKALGDEAKLAASQSAAPANPLKPTPGTSADSTIDQSPIHNLGDDEERVFADSLVNRQGHLTEVATEAPTENARPETPTTQLTKTKLTGEVTSPSTPNAPGAPAGFASPPVAWFSEENTSEGEAKPQAPSVPASTPMLTKEPVTDEPVFNINDFRELAEEPILPILGALKSDTVPVQETLEPRTEELNPPNANTATPAAEEPHTQPAEVQKPENQTEKAAGYSSIVNLNKSGSMFTAPTPKQRHPTIKQAAVPLKIQLSSPTEKKNEIENDSETDTASEPALAPMVEPNAKPSNATETASASLKKAESIDETLEAALAACESIEAPFVDDEVATFSEETFDSACLISNEGQSNLNQTKTTSSPLESTTPPTTPKSSTFAETTFENDQELILAGEGDLIHIDGNDGFDFIDLACFDRSAAQIKGDRILITEDDGTTFEVQFKNVAYVEFANGVKVELTTAK